MGENSIEEHYQQEKTVEIMRMFPERAIQASSLVDVFNTSQLDRSLFRIRNPMKKLAQNIDFAV